MDSPIAPAALRQADDGPAYDLISLGLVVFTTLLITVWTTHFFRRQPKDVTDLRVLEDRAERLPNSDVLTSAGHLQVAQWANFNLRAPGSNGIPDPFTQHMREALNLEVKERENLRLLTESPNVSEIDRVAAGEELRTKPPAREYVQKWYELRGAWLDARDQRGFDVIAHFDFQNVLLQFGMLEEAAGGKRVRAAFRDHLKAALAVEDRQRARLRKLLSEGATEAQRKALNEISKHPVQTLALEWTEAQQKALEELSKHPVRTFALEWYEVRAKWLRSRSDAPYDKAARLEFVTLLNEIGLTDEANRETADGSMPPDVTEPK